MVLIGLVDCLYWLLWVFVLLFEVCGLVVCVTLCYFPV